MSLPWQQYEPKYQGFEEIEGFISATSSVTTIFNSLSVLFTWVNHLWKFQRNLSGQTFEMEKYLLIKFSLTDFFIFLYCTKHTSIYLCARSLEWNARTSVCWRNFNAWKKYTHSNAHSNFENCQFLLFYNYTILCLFLLSLKIY